MNRFLPKHRFYLVHTQKEVDAMIDELKTNKR
jgi:hypothetical protein